MPEKKQINMGIEDGKEFFAHEMSLNFSPSQFIFDFRSITPRIDPRSKEIPFISLKHNVVMVDPFHAKRILEVLTNVVSEYEKQFGRIEKPEAVKKHEEKMKKMNKESDKKSSDESMPSYFG